MNIIQTAGDEHHPDCHLISEAAVDATDMARTMAADVKKNWKKEMIIRTFGGTAINTKEVSYVNYCD